MKSSKLDRTFPVFISRIYNELFKNKQVRFLQLENRPVLWRIVTLVSLVTLVALVKHVKHVKLVTLVPQTPVEPNPPAPRSVSSREVTTSNEAVSCLAITIWAIRSPSLMTKGSSE